MQVFRDAGFSQVKRWHQMMNHPIRTGADFIQVPIMAKLRAMEQNIQDTVQAVYDERSGANTPDLRTFEVIIVLAFKDN